MSYRYRRKRRRPWKRRIGYRKRRRFNTMPYVFKLGRRVKTLEKSIELKKHGEPLVDATVNDEYKGTCLVKIAQSMTDEGRIGTKILIKGLKVEVMVRNTHATIDTPVYFNIFLLSARKPMGLDLETGGALKRLNDYLVVMPNHMGDMIDMHEKSNFWVLANQWYCCVAKQPNAIKRFKYYKKFKKGLQVAYSDASATHTKIEKNALYVCVCTSDVSNSTIQGYGTVTFVDA